MRESLFADQFKRLLQQYRPVQYDDAHIRWCKKRYRSYDVKTDRYLGYDRKYHHCVSPYDYN